MLNVRVPGVGDHCSKAFIEMNQLKIMGDITICYACLNKDNKEKGNYLGTP